MAANFPFLSPPTIARKSLWPAATSTPVDRIRRLVWKIAFATLALMAVGSATRVMNAGLACPDWPLCYGQLVPQQQMNLQVFLEWFHRLDAALIGLSTLWLVVLCTWYRRQVPGWLPWAAVGALALIGVQGALGGLTVTQLLRFDIVTAHLGTALLFFSAMLVIASCLLPYRSTGTVGRLPWLGLGATAIVYVQCLLGGLVGSRWAAHQCLGLKELCQVMNSHLLGIVPATAAVLALTWTVWRTPALTYPLRRLGGLASMLLVFQLVMGIATFRLRLQVEPLTVAHHTLGAALVGTLVCFTVLAWRDSRSDLSQNRLGPAPTDYRSNEVASAQELASAAE
ncbi:heme A synthase [Nodosilinea sp. LEGE 06152]|uniref:COX15/CtaA family protein n=1 Tax=Nodosilinea sp. LEGE 06152 TaxID=2777966 RepID=UPI00187FA9F6|nr:heme A synthase [Nodosilinea sp. LEGE 06152]MBE9155608.1 heme A synthase [Nodosilinea sp. LEGE 06152]